MILRDNFLDNCEYFSRAIIRIFYKGVTASAGGNITCLKSTIKETLIVRLQAQGGEGHGATRPLTSATGLQGVPGARNPTLSKRTISNILTLNFMTKVINSTCIKMSDFQF